MNRLHLLLLVYWTVYCAAQSCEQSCQDGIEVKSKVLFCGTDGKEHLIPYEHEMQRVARCFNEKCNITSFTPGHCECPNYCFQGLGHGLCYQRQCHCYKGWTGKDCSLLECPNSCSNHGECKEAVLEGLIGAYCRCNEGWTGDNCATRLDALSRIPYGEYFGPENSEEPLARKDTGYWAKRDIYKDHHPLFHFEQIASINIQIPEENLQKLLAPHNKWNQDFLMNCTVFIDNAHQDRNLQDLEYVEDAFQRHHRGHVTNVIKDVGIRLKGTATREYLKKSFKLKFNTVPEDFMEGIQKPPEDAPERKRRFYQLKKLGLKAPFHDDSFIKNQIMAEFYRAWGIPATRASFAAVSINDLHWGLYWIHEPMDDLFLGSHYNEHHGNYYKAGCGGSYMVYLGEDPENYKNASKEFRDTVRPFVFQNQGNGNWEDFARMISVLWKTKSEDFEREIQKVVDVEKFLRYLVIETAVCNTDDYTRNGNNWRMFHNPETKKFEMHGFDWDITFRSVKCSIFGGDERAQLTHRILKVAAFKERYLHLMNLFMNKIWNSDILKDRIRRWGDLILEEVKKDYNYRLDFTRSEIDMMKEVEYMLNFIPARYENVMDQLQELEFQGTPDQDSDYKKAKHEFHSAIVLTILGGSFLIGLVLVYLGHMVKNYTKVKAKAILHGHHHRNYNTQAMFA